MRVVRAHHPLYLKTLPLVKYWDGNGERYVVIELPDGSHARIPDWWVDGGEGPPPALRPTTRKLSVTAARDLVVHLTRLRNRRDTRQP